MSNFLVVMYVNMFVFALEIEHNRTKLIQPTIANLFYSLPSFPAEWFLHLFHLPRLGIVKKLKHENAQDVVRKALNMSRLTGLAVDRDSA